MADLKKEYTDIKEIKHKVEHITIHTKEDNSREQIVEELFHALTRPGKRIPA